VLRGIAFAFAVLGMLAGSPAEATHEVVLRGVLHSGSPATFRVVSARGSVITDVTSEGLKVGVAPDGEERLALCRPAFVDDVSAFVNYQVVSALPEASSVAAGYFVPTGPWGAGTPASLLFEMKNQNPAPATPAYLTRIFQEALRRENNPTGSLGLLLQGTADFRLQAAAQIYFSVRLAIPFTVQVSNFAPACPAERPPLPGVALPPLIPEPVVLLTPAIPDVTMFLRSSLSGEAFVTVNRQPISGSLVRVVGQRPFPITIPAQLVVHGGNAVAISVTSDDEAAGQAPVTTSVTLTLGPIRQDFATTLVTVDPVTSRVRVAGGDFLQDRTRVFRGDILELTDVANGGALRRFRVVGVVAPTTGPADELALESLDPDGLSRFGDPARGIPPCGPRGLPPLATGSHGNVRVFAPICPADPPRPFPCFP
jgi:hypothetical protein